MSGLVCYLLLTEKCRKFVFDMGKKPSLQKMAFSRGTRAPPVKKRLPAIFSPAGFYCVKTPAKALRQRHPCRKNRKNDGGSGHR
jgi:hypothetical protein